MGVASDSRRLPPVRLPQARLALGRLPLARLSLARLLPLVAAWVVAGCTTLGPDYQRPDQGLPGHYGAAQAGDQQSTVVEVEWWRRFEDPVLNGLVARALEHNSDLSGALARVEEADALYDESVGGSWPRIDAEGSAQRARQPFLLSPTGFRVGNGVGVSAAASYEIDFWGRMRRTREAARAGAVGSRHAADVARISIAAGVAQTYVNLRALDEQVRLAERTVASRDEQLQVIQIQFEGGTSSSLDFQQVRGLKADALVQLRELQRQRDVAQAQLALLTGEPGALVPADGTADPLSRLPVPPVAPPGLPSDLLDRRPDVRLAEENLVAANAQIGIAKAAMMPSISLTGGLGQQSSNLASLFEASNRIWNVGFGLALPIFNGGALAARTRQAEARQKQLVAAYQGAARSAYTEVSNALVSATAARRMEDDVLERSAAAREAAGLARQRYEAGYSPYLEWLDAERTLFGAQLETIRNRQARLGYAIDLYRAMAGGWSDAQAATASADGAGAGRPTAAAPARRAKAGASRSGAGKAVTSRQAGARQAAAKPAVVKTRAQTSVKAKPGSQQQAKAAPARAAAAKRKADAGPTVATGSKAAAIPAVARR